MGGRWCCTRCGYPVSTGNGRVLEQDFATSIWRGERRYLRPGPETEPGVSRQDLPQAISPGVHQGLTTVLCLRPTLPLHLFFIHLNNRHVFLLAFIYITQSLGASGGKELEIFRQNKSKFSTVMLF